MSLLLRHASQLEWLAGGLAEDLARHRPETPFGMQTVLVAHAGMARWLRADLAKRSAFGIAAGCAFEQPGAFLHRLGDQLLGEPGAAPAHRPEVMQLALFDLLGQPEFGGSDTTLMQRFRNAGSIAQRLHRQGIYRSDWLLEYTRGRAGSQDARLWRALVDRLGSGDRASHMQRLRACLEGDAPVVLSPVYVFGLGHCPPDLLELLRLIGRHTPVYWYFLNPCREYWLDYLKPRQLTEAELARRAAHADAGPPLLGSLGEQGRELLAALLEADAHEAELDHVPNFPEGRLGLLQRAIFENEMAPRWSPDANDKSLMVHACASAWAELEAVREALDACASAHGDLRPDEVLIMAVDPGRYRPWLDAVFSREAPIWPLRVADLDWFEEEPWFQLLNLLLTDMGAPVRRSLWMSVLAHPEVQRHWRLDPEVVAKLAGALDRVHASFGIDGADRGDGNDTHSLGAGVDRLWRRYAGESEEMFWALTGLEAETLAHAEAVLAGLYAWSRFSRDNHGLSTWCSGLRNAVIHLCGPGLSEFSVARQALWGMLAELEERARQAMIQSPLPPAAFAGLLREQLSSPALDAPSPGGGIRFCGLLPFRSLPFRFIAVLGLEAGAFPRLEPEPGPDDRMRRESRRLLDRDRRSEDRYLFLEALLSARQFLHLSHVARASADGSEQAPSTLLGELIQVIDEAEGAAARGLGRHATRDWLRIHPALPFAAERFERGSSAAAWLPAARALHVGPEKPSPWFAAPAADTAVALSDIQDFLRHPGKWFVRRRLGLSLDREYWADPDEEPLRLRPAYRTRRLRELLELSLAEGAVPDSPPQSWVELATLPVGQLGARSFAALRTECEETLNRADSDLGTSWRKPERILAIHGFDIGGLVVHGRIRLKDHGRILAELHAEPGPLLAELFGLVVAALSEGSGKQLHVLFEWSRPDQFRKKSGMELPSRIDVSADHSYWQPWLAAVTSAYLSAYRQPLLLPWHAAMVAWNYMDAESSARLASAEKDFFSEGFKNGEHADPHWRMLIGRGALFADAAAGALFLDQSAQLLQPVFDAMQAYAPGSSAGESD